MKKIFTKHEWYKVIVTGMAFSTIIVYGVNLLTIMIIGLLFGIYMRIRPKMRETK